MTPAAPMTAEEFAEKYGGDYVELIDGYVVPIQRAGGLNGWVCVNVIGVFSDAVGDRARWLACSNDTFVLTGRNPDRVRGADFVLWRQELVPRPLPDLVAVPPSLVVEVKRPFDTADGMEAKAAEYLSAGVPVVLVVDPREHTVTVSRPTGGRETHGIGDELSLPDVLPGFAVPVRKFFE
ncbi:MAG: Uma2 family endonuclease [Gemmataceae bacterium]|nr:Uma2 family endonuclease [Gemmataceae bacterium]